jgi:transcriptional regulator with XRE-family HTH domain
VPEPNFWGTLIKSLREDQGYTQRTLAVAAKVNRNTLRRIEAGDTTGGVGILESVLWALGYELEALASPVNCLRLQGSASRECKPSRRAKLAQQRVLAMPISLLRRAF